MPRPKPKQTSPNFTVRAHSLTDAQQAKLLELLGYDAASLEAAEHPGYRVLKREPGAPLVVEKVSEPKLPAKNPYEAIRSIEISLGLYVDGAEHLDNIPRPADYREAFSSVEREASRLLNTIAGWTEYYREQFAARGADVHEIEQALARLLEVANAVVREMKQKSSKGARRQAALKEVIRLLRLTFRDYYQGKRTARKRQGAFQSLAPWEKSEREFVRSALRAARIIPEGYRDLSRLFLDERCAVLEDPTEP